MYTLIKLRNIFIKIIIFFIKYVDNKMGNKNVPIGYNKVFILYTVQLLHIKYIYF